MPTDTTTALRTLTFTVPGRPVPKVRMTQRSKWSPKAQACLKYQGRVRLCAFVAANEAGLVPKNMRRNDSVFTVPVRVDWIAYISKQRGVPDKDNIEKSLCDGLQPEIVRDDNITRVPQGSGDVIYGVPEKEQRVEIVVTELTEGVAEYMRAAIWDALECVKRLNLEGTP